MSRPCKFSIIAGVFALSIGASQTARGDSPVEALRIVSVGGAVTEIVFGLGLGKNVVAVDTTSTFPDSTERLPKVGYLRTLSAEGLLSLAPDLILAGPEAGPPPVLAQIRDAGVAIVVVDADYSVEGARERIRRVAEALNRESESAAMIAKLDADVERNRPATNESRPKVVFMISPPGVGTPLVAGDKTAAAAMIELAGAANAVRGFNGYKPLTPEALVAAAPDVVAVPAETLATSSSARAFLEQAGMASGSPRLVEVEPYMLGFGPRTGAAIGELAERFHADGAARSDGDTKDDTFSIETVSIGRGSTGR